MSSGPWRGGGLRQGWAQALWALWALWPKPGLRVWILGPYWTYLGPLGLDPIRGPFGTHLGPILDPIWGP